MHKSRIFVLCSWFFVLCCLVFLLYKDIYSEYCTVHRSVKRAEKLLHSTSMPKNFCESSEFSALNHQLRSIWRRNSGRKVYQHLVLESGKKSLKLIANSETILRMYEQNNFYRNICIVIFASSLERLSVIRNTWANSSLLCPQCVRSIWYGQHENYRFSFIISPYKLILSNFFVQF